MMARNSFLEFGRKIFIQNKPSLKHSLMQVVTATVSSFRTSWRRCSNFIVKVGDTEFVSKVDARDFVQPGDSMKVGF